MLQSIELEVEQGSLVCVIGRVAAGKTALLHAILGEMVLINGTVGSMQQHGMTTMIRPQSCSLT